MNPGGGGGGGGELLNGQCMRRSRFFCQRGERGGVGSKPNGEKTALIFFMFVLGFFLVQNFPGGGGPTIYEGGVQMLISIEFDSTCDLPGMGVRTPTPPPPSLWICTCMTFKD